MNMMRYDIDELEIDAELIQSSKVIKGYIYLSEEIAEEKTKEQQERRTTLLFMCLIASIALYLWNNHFFLENNQSLQSYHSTAGPSISHVLSDNLIELPTPSAGANLALNDLAENVDSMSLTIPEDIVRFIDAGIVAETLVVTQPKVVLEEVKAVSSNKLDIDRILASAKNLFNRDRLMSPPVHNAFARYEKVLSVYPDNPEALKGIQNIVDRYVNLAEMVISKNEAYKVPGLIKKAYQAGEKYVDVSVIIGQFSDYLSNDSIFLDNNELAQQSSGTVEISSNDGVAGKNEGVQQKIESDNHMEAIFVADKKISEAAYRLFVDGDLLSAKKMLQNFTRLSGFWGASNDLLLKIHLSLNEVANAENLIYENKALDAYQFAEKAARVMMARGDSTGALDMLAAYRPDFLENRAYYTLLASLYHKTGNFRRSVYWYRQLLSIDHKDARLWLGLAVSLDALNNVDDALQAFDYVRLYAQNDSVVKDYIDERMVALSPNAIGT